MAQKNEVQMGDVSILLDIAKRLMSVMKDLKKVKRYKDEDGKNRDKLWPETYHKMLHHCLGRIADSRSDIMAVASMLLNDEVERMAQEDEA